MSVTASILVNFGGDQTSDNDYLTAELDNERNKGKSSFSRGDQIYFRIYSNVPYTVEHSQSTSPQIIWKIGTEYETLTEIVEFAKTPEGSVSKPIYSLDSISWYGNQGPPVSGINVYEPSTVNIGSDLIAVANVGYTSVYDLWRLDAPNFSQAFDSYYILIYIEGESS